ncbi:restriction endonuclease [Curtobacterium sp. CFBP9011]|uniref:restriction endonuclease n=1 Tax=Curtobacterium sp. CFBP9011 TaxID=3096530 RepID=UPI0039C8685F
MAMALDCSGGRGLSSSPLQIPRSAGVTTVRQLNGVLPIHRAQLGIVVTTGTFTRGAVTTARQLGIIDPTPNRTDTGQAKLLDMAPGRCSRTRSR